MGKTGVAEKSARMAACDYRGAIDSCYPFEWQPLFAIFGYVGRCYRDHSRRTNFTDRDCCGRVDGRKTVPNTVAGRDHRPIRGLVVWHKVDVAAVSTNSLIAVGTGLIALTAGTLYQRQFCAQVDLRSSTFIQFGASLLVIAPLSYAVEGARIDWSWSLVAAVLFLVIFASMLAVNALTLLLRRGAVTRVTGMLYLPPVVAVTAEWLLFGVRPTWLTALGVIIVCIGVALTARGK